jgi:hypothetical protein
MQFNKKLILFLLILVSLFLLDSIKPRYLIIVHNAKKSFIMDEDGDIITNMKIEIDIKPLK